MKYVIENVKGKWTVFSIVESRGKIFKNWVAEFNKKSEAETCIAKLI